MTEVLAAYVRVASADLRSLVRHIRSRSGDEAAKVLRYLAGDADRMDNETTPGILRNLIG